MDTVCGEAGLQHAKKHCCILITEPNPPKKNVYVNYNKMTESKISFAAKLAAFMLNAQKHPVKCFKKIGFQKSTKYIKGIIPLLHMNISKSEFKTIMTQTSGNIMNAMVGICNEKQMEEMLSFEKFNCKAQCGDSANILIERFVDTIEMAYSTRPTGQQRVRELASYMKWQSENDIIPKSSVKWCHGIKAIQGLIPK